MTLCGDEMRAVILEHVEAENGSGPERVIGHLQPQRPIFEDVPSGARYAGGDEIVGNYRHLWDELLGLTREITRWTFGDGAAVIELILRGRHEGRFRGVPATNRRLALRVIAHFEFDSEGRYQQETA